jgi:hypothetical protein
LSFTKEGENMKDPRRVGESSGWLWLIPVAFFLSMLWSDYAKARELVSARQCIVVAVTVRGALSKMNHHVQRLACSVVHFPEVAVHSIGVCPDVSICSGAKNRRGR